MMTHQDLKLNSDKKIFKLMSFFRKNYQILQNDNNHLLLLKKGQVFVEPYKFSFDGKIGMTISQKFEDSKTKEFKSIMSLDYEIQNLIDLIFKPQDRYSNESDFKGYSIFFHEYNQTIFYHKDWERSKGSSFSWSDLEYGYSSSPSESQIQQKQDFKNKVEKIIQFSKNNPNNLIDNITDIDPYFFTFEKQDENYLSIVYPVVVRVIDTPFNKNKKLETVMFVGRVQNDKSGILTSSSWEKRITYLCNFLQPFLILIIIFICIMHYAAVLVFRIEVPIKLLKKFILQRVKHYESMKKNPNKKPLRSVECTPFIRGKNRQRTQLDKLNLNKQYSDQIMNTSIAPLNDKNQNINPQSEKFQKLQKQQIDGKRKNTSLLLTCDGNSESLQQIVDEDKIQNKYFNASNQITNLPTQFLSQSFSPMAQTNKYKQSPQNRFQFFLNSNKLLRKSSESQISKPQQSLIYSHLCQKTQKYSHGQKCEEKDEQSELESNKNQKYNDQQPINQQQEFNSKNHINQQFNTFQNIMIESNNPIQILPNQQTPRLDNDRNEELEEQNEQQRKIYENNKISQQYQKASDIINLASLKTGETKDIQEKMINISKTQLNNNYSSPFSSDLPTLHQIQQTSTKHSLIPTTPKDSVITQQKQNGNVQTQNLILQTQNDIQVRQEDVQLRQDEIVFTPKEIHLRLDQIQFKHDETVASQNQILKNQVHNEVIHKEVSNKIHKKSHTCEIEDLEQQKYSQVDKSFTGQQQRKDSKTLKGINFLKRTQSFLKQQLAQITESAKQFGVSITSRDTRRQSNPFKSQAKNILYNLESPILKRGNTQNLEEKLPQLNYNQSQLSMAQNDFEGEYCNMQVNQEFETVVQLEDIQTYYHELEVIVSTFQHLFGVISYMEEGYEKGDFSESLFRLNHAVTIFKYINNISAVGMAYFDIGNMYFGEGRLEEAIEKYSISLSCAFQQFEVNSISHFNEMLSSGQLSFDYIALSQFLPRLYFISLSFKEKAISKSDDIQLIGRDNSSKYLLNQAVLYLKTCLRVAMFLKKLQNDQYKLLEIIIFIHLFLSEAYIYLNEDFLSENTLKQATKHFEQLIHKNKQQQIQNNLQSKILLSPRQGRKKSDNSQNEAQIFEDMNLIKSSFYYVRGIIQIKKGLYKDGCDSLTSYLESTRAYLYQQKSLYFIRNVFKKQHIETNTIEKRIEKSVPIFYDIYILIDINELTLYNISNASLQLKILTHLKQQFIQTEDKVCVILYNQDFYILQPLMIFQNNKHWDICFENIKEALIAQRSKSSSTQQTVNETQNVTYQTNYTSNQKNNCQPATPKEQIIRQYSQTINQNGNYSEWEESIYKALYQVSLQEIAAPIDITQIKRKTILLTFSFSQTSPISNEFKFSQNIATLFDTFHKKPTVINYIFNNKQESQSQMTVSQNIYKDSFNSGIFENTQQGSFHQHVLNSQNQQKKNQKVQIINKNLINNNYPINSFQTPQSIAQNHIIRPRDLTLYDLNDDLLPFSLRQEQLKSNKKQLDTMSTPHDNNKNLNDMPKNKIKKFHIFQREHDLYSYLQQKRVIKSNFHLFQRKFFK